MQNINDQGDEMKAMDPEVDLFDELVNRNDGPRPQIGFITVNHHLLRDALEEEPEPEA